MIPYRIYLSGGGICVVAHVGALMELAKHIPLKAVKEWMGVSAGALVSMCLSIGFTLEELYDVSTRFDFTEIKETDSIPGWIIHFGVDTGERLHRLVNACLHVKGLASETTFKQIHDRFGISLKVVATDLNEAAAVIYSPVDTPDTPVSDAVRASMTFPYYFQPFLCPRTGHYLADGAIISNYPMFILPREEHRRTLSILIRTTTERKENLMEELGMDQLIARPLNIALNEKVANEARFYDSHCVQIFLGNADILDFGMDSTTKESIVQQGRDAMNGYMRQQKGAVERRRSI